MANFRDTSPITFIIDVVYGEAGGAPLLLDIVRPNSIPGELMPAALWFHGGGWESGDKNEGMHSYLNPFLARHGFFTASINYRLSGQAVFPAQIHDAKAAVRWLRANATHYHIDPERIGMWGHSSGGHLAALLGTSGDVPALEGTGAFVGRSSRVDAVIALSAPSDFLRSGKGQGYEERLHAQSRLVGGPLEERTDVVRLANPITHVRSGAPAFLLVHGDQDEIVPFGQSELLYQALTMADIDATFIRVQGGDHSLEGHWQDIAQWALAFFRMRLRHH